MSSNRIPTTASPGRAPAASPEARRGASGLVERLVPDELWSLFREVVPPTVVSRPQGGGRRRADDREVLAAIFLVASAGCTWRQLPPGFGPCWPTVYRRYAEWSRAHVWPRLHQSVVDRMGECEAARWSLLAISSVTLRRGRSSG
ncbi:transposase [Streptomyces avicenniae]|uniref:transposase n=1 Tax=Streptomyces avicenniae TaxID=500153 RepID=UPI000A51C8B4|nr:transposase [Streptomyces avicenniae]